ncbi:unnamed protein product, partial [Ectocarpus fasciculatus]
PARRGRRLLPHEVSVCRRLARAPLVMPHPDHDPRGRACRSPPPGGPVHPRRGHRGGSRDVRVVPGCPPHHPPAAGAAGAEGSPVPAVRGGVDLVVRLGAAHGAHGERGRRRGLGLLLSVLGASLVPVGAAHALQRLAHHRLEHFQGGLLLKPL